LSGQPPRSPISQRGWKRVVIGRIYAELLAVQSQIGMTWPNGKGKYGVHKLRHFYASIMITAGTQPKRLQELLGHSTLAMTMDTYGHLFPPTEE